MGVRRRARADRGLGHPWPAFGFSETWQLVINTGTTVITFLMVFLIQNTQNRDAKAIQLELDELLRGVEGARAALVAREGLSDGEPDRLEREFDRIRNRAAGATPAHGPTSGKRAAGSAGSAGRQAGDALFVGAAARPASRYLPFLWPSWLFVSAGAPTITGR